VGLLCVLSLAEGVICLSLKSPVMMLKDMYEVFFLSFLFCSGLVRNAPLCSLIGYYLARSKYLPHSFLLVVDLYESNSSCFFDSCNLQCVFTFVQGCTTAA